MMDLNEIFLKSYLNEYSEREKKKILHSQEDRFIAAEKKKKLAIIEEFLQKFVDLEIYVHHRDQYTKNLSNNETVEPKLFSYYLVDSSKPWSPGISIFFDHPAEVEIAIPNQPQEEGIVVIRVASHHPDQYILEQKFQNFESACEAIGKFLGKCTVRIEKDPRKYFKEHLAKKQANSHDFLNNVPDAPPESEIENNRRLYQHGRENPSSEGLSLRKIGEFFSIHKPKESGKENDEQ